MLLSDVAITLEGLLNAAGDITFSVTDSLQNWFNWNIKDADGNSYVPIVVQAQPVPELDDYYTTRRYSYTARLKGQNSQRGAIEAVVKNAGTDKWKLSNFIVNDTFNSEGVSGFIASFRITVIVQTNVKGRDVKIKINDTPVRVVDGFDSFDKALISSIEFGNNSSLINTGSEHSFVFVLDGNAAVDEIFNDIINDSFNKLYEFEFNYIAATVTVSLTLRRGTVKYNDSNDPVMVGAVFTRGLERREVTINDVPVSAIGFTPQLVVDPLARSSNGVTKLRGGNVSRNYSFYLENDKSTVINELIDEFKTYTGKIFNLKFKMNDIEIETECLLLNFLAPSSENADAVFNITLGERG